jgi:hypothetical protein
MRLLMTVNTAAFAPVPKGESDNHNGSKAWKFTQSSPGIAEVQQNVRKKCPVRGAPSGTDSAAASLVD